MALVNAFGDLSLEETQQAVLYLLALMSDKMARLDTADRMTVNVETGAITASIASAQTLATVTAVTALHLGAASRAADLIPHNAAQMGALHLYNNIIVS